MGWGGLAERDPRVCSRSFRWVLSGQESWAGGGRGGPQTTASTPSRALLVILAKYGLDGRKDARAVSSNLISHGPADHSLEDPRLEKLWHKVLSALPSALEASGLGFWFPAPASPSEGG